MASLLLAGVVGPCIGFNLGVLVVAVVVAGREDARPTPAGCAYPRGACLVAHTPGHAF
jgi:hypothetical protein